MRSTKSHLVTIAFGVAACLLFTGIGSAQTSASTAAAKEYKRLVSLQKALSKIPMDKENKEPHRSFLKRNDKDIVYSDPAGEWYVRSKRFWDLQKKYHTLPIADKIAWTASENSLPGECEGYVNCYIAVIRMTHGEYLKRYPKGAYTKRALQQMIVSLSYIPTNTGSSERKNYDGPTDTPDRAELVNTIQELRRIISKVSQPEKAKALSLLKLIEDAFK